MAEEFTTKMHSELLGKEMNDFEMAIMAIQGAINRGIPKAQALKKYAMPEKIFDDNVKEVMSSLP